MKTKEDLSRFLDDLYDSGYKPNDFERDFLIFIEDKLKKQGTLNLTGKQKELFDKIIDKSKSRWNNPKDMGYI